MKINWTYLKHYLIARLSEKSTWLGLLTLAASVTGIVLSPELTGQMASFASAGFGLLGIILPEKRP